MACKADVIAMPPSVIVFNCQQSAASSADLIRFRRVLRCFVHSIFYRHPESSGLIEKQRLYAFTFESLSADWLLLCGSLILSVNVTLSTSSAVVSPCSILLTPLSSNPP